jgi:hypothetical protein
MKGEVRVVVDAERLIIRSLAGNWGAQRDIGEVGDIILIISQGEDEYSHCTVLVEGQHKSATLRSLTNFTDSL